jgi:hypothetical protein
VPLDKRRQFQTRKVAILDDDSPVDDREIDTLRVAECQRS